MNYTYEYNYQNSVAAEGEWPQYTDDALEESILGWRWVARGLEDEIFPVVPAKTVDSCALCQIHFDNALCGDCPVKLRVNRRGCIGTPFDAYYEYLEDERGTPGYARAAAIARDEVAFLESLRKGVPRQKVLDEILELTQTALALGNE